MSKRKPLVVVTRKLPDVVETRMMELFNTRLNATDEPMGKAELVEAVKTAEVLVPTVTDRIDKAVLMQAGDQLKLIANFGNGVDNIDVETALSRGITVTNTPGVLTEDTADFTMALIMAVSRRIIEGALIGAYAIGASKIFFYVRGEYPLAIRRLSAALEECRAAGYIGANILGSAFSVEVEVRSGAGAYICGEETALLESIEGKRGFPRVKPPFPVTHGLFGQPTVINNVETMAKIPYIVVHGPDAFRELGTDASTGPKLMCLSGDVVRPGLYEVHFGITLRTLLDELAGGVTGELQAILLGGAAGTFATPAQLDVRLTFEDLRAAGLTLGSGAIMVFNTERDLRDILVRLGRFFAHESCGKCYPCQLGTQRQLEILERVEGGRTFPGDAERLQDVGWTMTDASLCGLGQTAASAVLSAMKHWPELFAQ